MGERARPHSPLTLSRSGQIKFVPLKFIVHGEMGGGMEELQDSDIMAQERMTEGYRELIKLVPPIQL